MDCLKRYSSIVRYITMRLADDPNGFMMTREIWFDLAGCNDPTSVETAKAERSE